MITSDKSYSYSVLLVSVVLAGIFFYAGIDKIRDPLQFADNVAGLAFCPLCLSTCSRSGFHFWR